MGTKGLGALRQGSVERRRSAAKRRGCESWRPTGNLGRAVLATLMVMVGLTSAVQAAATAPAGASSACTSAAFDDTFTTDTALSSCWQTGTPLISSFESKIGATNAAPQLSFGNGMEMSGAAGVNQFSAIQSVAAYSAPFTFSVTALQLGAGGDEPFSYGSGLGIYLVNSSLGQAFSAEANFNPDAGSNYGIWANNGLTADGTGTKVYASPSASNPYEITMSVDGSGNATVSVTIPFQGGTGAEYTIGNVGTGPFYLMLGQDEGTPNAQVLSDQATFPESANLTDWESAKLNYCSTTSLVDDFSADQALSNCWETGTSEIGTVASDLGDSAVPVRLQFGSSFGPSFGDYMDVEGTGGNNQLAAIQSAAAYQAPFQFDASVADINSVHADTSWGIWLVNSANPTDTFSLQMNDDGLDADFGLYASDRLADAPSYSSTLLSGNPQGGTYSVAMTIDSGGNASVSLSDVFEGDTTQLGDFSVGNVGLGSFYVLLGQQEGNLKQAQFTGSTEAGWFSADLSPNYCSPQAAGTFTDNFATDTSLNSACWSTSGPAISQLGDKFGELNAAYTAPDLNFINGMEMGSGGGEGANFSGVQSTYAYSAPFDFETTVTGTSSGDSAFSVYLVGGDDGGLAGVEGNLDPGNGPNYGIWDNQESLPAGNGFPGSEDLIASPSEGTPYNISISVSASGTASVEVNGVTSATHADVGPGPYYLFLGQRYISGEEETSSRQRGHVGQRQPDHRRHYLEVRFHGLHCGRRGKRTRLRPPGLEHQWSEPVGRRRRRLRPAQLHRPGCLSPQLHSSELHPAQLHCCADGRGYRRRRRPGRVVQRVVVGSLGHVPERLWAGPGHTVHRVGRDPGRHAVREHASPGGHVGRGPQQQHRVGKPGHGRPRRARPGLEPPQFDPSQLHPA